MKDRSNRRIVNAMVLTLGLASNYVIAQGGDLAIYGYTPAEYIGAPNPDAYAKVEIKIKDGIIESIREVTSRQIRNLSATSREEGYRTLVLKTGWRYDVIYPGLTDLHNHTKQNNLGVWDEAKGQFANRFEWRAWTPYKKAVSANMNPWVNYGKPITCAVFRWSELQAMVYGTTYLQGPSSCVSNFGIHRVEDGNTFRSDPGVDQRGSVQAPTDIIIPADFTFVWNFVRPRMNELAQTNNFRAAIAAGVTYEDGLKSLIHEYCPPLQTEILDVDGPDELAILKDKARLEADCDADKYPPKFIRYTYWQHKTIAARKAYLSDPNRTAVIGHLSEGRRSDPYNKLEFELIVLLGLDQPHVNFVHGVGIDKSSFEHMANKQMGLIWSPFSNLLLYGETADIKAAKEAGVTIALGSDWTPTGSKAVLEELSVARRYVQKQDLDDVFTDRELYYMVTRNPAILIDHFENNANDGYHDMGTIRPDALADLIVIRRSNRNPYTNLVTSDAEDVRLVIVDGKPMYGTKAYVETYAGELGESLAELGVEDLTTYYSGIHQIAQRDDVPRKAEQDLDGSAGKLAHLQDIAQYIAEQDIDTTQIFGAADKRLLIKQHSKDDDLAAFAEATGIDIDSALDIQKLIAINILSQSRNLSGHPSGEVEYAVDFFTPLYTDEEADPGYAERLNDFIKLEGDGEMTANLSARQSLRGREQLNLGFVPKRMAEAYGLVYDQEDY